MNACMYEVPYAHQHMESVGLVWHACVEYCRLSEETPGLICCIPDYLLPSILQEFRVLRGDVTGTTDHKAIINQ